MNPHEDIPENAGDEVSHDVYTRRLIVTLPNVSGEEADETAAWIERASRRDVPGITTTHALGQTVPEHARVFRSSDQEHVIVAHRYTGAVLSPLDVLGARQLAGVLLAHADAIESRVS